MGIKPKTAEMGDTFGYHCARQANKPKTAEIGDTFVTSVPDRPTNPRQQRLVIKLLPARQTDDKIKSTCIEL